MIKNSIIAAILCCTFACVAQADPRFASLRLTSQPDYAEVLLDGQSRGKTPLEVKAILPGKHLLVVTKSGFRRYVKELTFEGDKRVVGMAKLEPMTQAEQDSSRQLDSIRLAGTRRFVENFPERHPYFTLNKPPELRKKGQPVLVRGATAVPVFIQMLVAENGSVIHAGIVTGSGSLALDDAALDVAEQCLFSPALGPDGQPAPVRVIGSFSARLPLDAESASSRATAAMRPADAQGRGAAPDMATMIDGEELPSGKTFTAADESMRRAAPVYFDTTNGIITEGSVLVRMLIHSNGHPAQAEVYRSSGDVALDQAAVAVAKQWLFTPALAPGNKPGKVWIMQVFTFKLN